MCHQFSSKSVERMKGVHPDLITIFTEAIKNSPIDFGIPESGGVRTQGEQNILFQKGVSKCDGFNDISNHQIPAGDSYGLALDFYAYINGRASWNKVHLAMVASCIITTAKRLNKEGKIDIELTWGAEFGSDNFHGWDMPHIQINLSVNNKPEFYNLNL